MWQQKCQSVSKYAFLLFAFAMSISLSMENMGFFLSVIPALLSGLVWTQRKILFNHFFSILLLAIIGLFILGVFYGTSEWSWRLTVLRKESGILLILVLLPLFSYDRQFLLNVLRAFVLGALVVVVIAWLGRFHLLPNIAWFQHPAPYYSFFKIYSGMFTAFAAFLCLVLLKYYWDSSQKWFWFFCFLVISYFALVQSGARTGYIVYFISLLAFAFLQLKSKQRLWGLLAVFLLLILALLFSATLKQGVTTAVKASWTAVTYDKALKTQQGYVPEVRSSAGVRYMYLRNSFHLWKQKPILGWGTGGYRYGAIQMGGITAGGYISELQASAQTTPENTYYRLLVESGAVGLLLWLLLWGWQLRVAFQFKDPVYRVVAVAFMLTMIVASMSQDLLLDESPRLFYILFTTVLFAPVILREKMMANND